MYNSYSMSTIAFHRIQSSLLEMVLFHPPFQLNYHHSVHQM